MSKMSKKLIAVFLALVLIFSLAGCSNSNSTKTSDKTTSTTTDNNSTTKTEAKQDERDVRYPAFDFGGRTIKVGLWWDYYYDSDNTSINDDPNLSNAKTAQMRLDNVRRIEKKYNVKIKFENLTWDGIIKSINTSIPAGTPECDIYLTDLQFGIPAVAHGLAQDLSKIAPKNSDLFTDNKIVRPLKVNGGTYLFQEQGLQTSGIFLGYNATMIKELGLEDPQELYKNGQWTWDKFEEYCKKGTRDTNGDGAVDVYGFGGVFTDLVNGLMMNNGGSIAATKTEGLSSKPTMETLDFINKLYNVDHSARPWNTQDWNDNLLAWSSGKVMFWTAQAWLLKQEADKASSNGGSGLPFDYKIVPYPVGPSGDGKIYSPVQGNWYMIPVGVKDADKVYQVFEDFLDWYNGDTSLRDDPTWFESCFQNEDDVKLALDCDQNQKLDIWSSLSSSGFDFGATIWQPIIVDKKSTVAQAVEAAKPVLQGALDKFWSGSQQ